MARPSGNIPKRPYFLTGTEIVWRAFPRKPALGSSTDQFDLLTTLSIQASRTEEQKSEAVHDKDYSIKLVTDVIDPDFETKYPMTFEVLKRADLGAYFINSMLKKANGRPRPFVQHPALVQPLFTAGDFSYPSGHSSGTELQARILGTLLPAQSEQLLIRARQVADSRVIAGVHYTSDTLAGSAISPGARRTPLSGVHAQPELDGTVKREPADCRTTTFQHRSIVSGICGFHRFGPAEGSALDSFSSNHWRPARLKCETLIRWDRGLLQQPPRWS